MKFREATERYLREAKTRGLRLSSLDAYRRRLQPALDAFGDLPVKRVTRGHVLGALEQLKDDGKPLVPERSRPAVLKAIRAVLRASGSTAADRLQVRVDQPDRRYLTSAQLGVLRAALRADEDPAALVLLVLIGSGARISEVLRLRGDVRGGSISIGSDSKSGRARTVDLPAWCIAAAEQLLALKERPGERRVRRHLARVLKRAGLPDVNVHGLRHSRITAQLLAGVPVLHVAAQAGHQSPGYLQSVYGHALAASAAQRRRWADAE